jgi:uncharacterized protein YbjT (DUF2867 family)
VTTKEAAKPEPRVALLAGASGLTGAALLRLLLRTSDFSRVLALSRRPLPVEHARLANRILRFDELARSLKGQRCTDAFCTLGAAGGPRATEQQLREVDLQLVLDFAGAALAAGATRLVVISAAGADRAAARAFLRVKGEMEAGLRPMGFAGIDILQPGLVYGSRPHDGLAAMLGQAALGLAAPLARRTKVVPNPLSGEELAAAMLGAARSQRRGPANYASDSLATLVSAGNRGS